MPYILCITNQKGGVGKTTTAVNLAASLAIRRKQVLLIDSDPQSNATLSLGVSPNSGYTLYEVFRGQKMLSDVIIRTHVKCFSLVPSSIHLCAAEVELGELRGKESLLKSFVKDVLGQFDYVLIDCPPSLGILTINAILASTHVLVPLQCEYLAIEGLKQLLKTVRRIKHHFNPDVLILGFLLTMYDRRVNLSSEIESEMRKRFKSTVLRTVIPRNVKLSESPSFSKTIFEYDKNCAGAKAYAQLAVEIARRCARKSSR
jgi:chromosome partitioning protein